MVLLYLRRSPQQLLAVTSDPCSLLYGPTDTTLAPHQANPRNPIGSKGMQSRVSDVDNEIIIDDDDERINDHVIDNGMIDGCIGMYSCNIL